MLEFFVTWLGVAFGSVAVVATLVHFRVLSFVVRTTPAERGFRLFFLLSEGARIDWQMIHPREREIWKEVARAVRSSGQHNRATPGLVAYVRYWELLGNTHRRLAWSMEAPSIRLAWERAAEAMLVNQ